MPTYRSRVRENRGGNWWWAHNAIVDRYARDLGPYGVAVYVCLCRHVGDDQETWIHQDTIAEEMGMSRRQVVREIARLEEAGLVSSHEQHDGEGLRVTNIYTLLPPRAPDVRATRRPSDSQSQRGDSQSQRVRLGVTAMNKTQRTRPMNKTGLDPALAGYSRFEQS